MYFLDIRIKRHHGQPMTRPGIEPGFGLHGNFLSHWIQKAGADHPLRVGSLLLLLPTLVNREWGCSCIYVLSRRYVVVYGRPSFLEFPLRIKLERSRIEAVGSRKTDRERCTPRG
jgi:hypothetical protein